MPTRICQPATASIKVTSNNAATAGAAANASATTTAANSPAVAGVSYHYWLIVSCVMCYLL